MSCPPNCHLVEAVKDEQKARGEEKGQGRESTREEPSKRGRTEGPALCVQGSGVGGSILRSLPASSGWCELKPQEPGCAQLVQGQQGQGQCLLPLAFLVILFLGSSCLSALGRRPYLAGLGWASWLSGAQRAPQFSCLLVGSHHASFSSSPSLSLFFPPQVLWRWVRAQVLREVGEGLRSPFEGRARGAGAR